MNGHDWQIPDRPHRGAQAGRAYRGMAQEKHVARARTVGYLRGGAGYCSTLRIRRNRGAASYPPGKNLTRRVGDPAYGAIAFSSRIVGVHKSHLSR